MAKWKQINKTQLYVVYKKLTLDLRIYINESEEMGKIFHTNGNQKRVGVTILILDKIDFTSKTVTRDKKGHYIMIHKSIHQEDTTIINLHALNLNTLKN